MTARLTVFLSLALAVFSFSSASATAAVILPTGLPSGSQYQLIFATSGTITGTSGLGSAYNAFASSEAASLASLLPLGVTWSAVVSTTDGTIANTNAPSSGMPVYNTAGIKVTNSSIYAGTLLSPVLYDQGGNLLTDRYAWTGSNPNGTPFAPWLLGHATDAILGQTFNTSGAWMAQNTGSVSTSRSIYVLSSPITVPEPSACVLMAMAAAAWAWCARRRVAST